MKIVVEIEGETQCSFGGHRYIGSLSEPPSYVGARVTGVIVDAKRMPDGTVQERDVLHVEGNIDAIIEAFKESLSQLESLREIWREEAHLARVNSVKCDKCGIWVDTRAERAHLLCG